MILAVDIGNTMVKAAVFDNGEIVETFSSPEAGESFLEPIFAAYPQINRSILISLRADNSAAEKFLKKRTDYLRFDPSVPTPVKNLYKTPETLGSDRLAAAVGAMALYPGTDVLIVDFGTAITMDVVTKKGEFLGGNISPGAAIRFRALHDYTSRLPLRALTESTALIGGSTNEAVESGVIDGIVYEIEGYINRLGKKYEGLRVVFTGGDGNFFAKRLKNPIFATYDLVVYGLNRILEYNAD